MTVSAQDGPLITKGWEAARGSTTPAGPTSAPQGYQTGQDNPDAGPNVFYAGDLIKDAYYNYREGGGSLLATGYPNQALGFVEHQILTADFTPNTIATANIAALGAPTAATPLTLVAVTGAGVTVTTAVFDVLNSGKRVPSGMRRIGADPSWQAFGTSGAIKGWSGLAAGRGVSLTSGANLSGINFLIAGCDIWGYPQTELVVGPNANTVFSEKTWKWIASVTPDGTSASTVSVGTSDIFGFNLRADRFSQLTTYYNGLLITANTGFVAADLTSPATTTTGDPRGTFLLPSASDGTKRLTIYQRLTPAQLATSPPALGMFGPTPV